MKHGLLVFAVLAVALGTASPAPAGNSSSAAVSP
jgi:hypothetical protein